MTPGTPAPLRRLATTLIAFAALAACAAPPQPATGGTQPRRAILMSFDALAEERLRRSVPPHAVPGLLAFFDQAACAAYAVPAFPSVTAPGHAALWTGAYGDVSGIAANWQPRLPQEAHSLLEQRSGYSAEALKAEPIWITAARAGRTVVGHQVTQAPQAPGFPAVRGAGDDALRARRADARRVLATPHARVLNGYDRRVEPHRLIDEQAAPPRPASGWLNLERLGDVGVAPLELAWPVAGDTVHALLFGQAAYTHVLVARTRDAAAGVIAAAAPVETAPVADRELARHFSAALPIHFPDGSGFLRVRLFALAPDASSFVLFQPAIHVTIANRPDVQAAYDAAVRGWVGNSPIWELRDGMFGPTVLGGGDGTAENRYMEALELVTRQFLRGTDWAWHQVRADLLLDYFPVVDEVDHAFYGQLDDRWPGYDANNAARVQALRARIWELVDLRARHLIDKVRTTPNTALFVSGDHGMRATWRVFRPNAALREAGLLHLTPAGEIDLARTRALSPNGYWINVNRTAWRDGIVPPEDEADVLAAAAAALRGARDERAATVVTEIYLPPEHPELGIGGPVGGDLYFGTAPGIRWSGDPAGPVIGPGPIAGTHGFPPTDPDMHTLFCMLTRDATPRRTRPVRTIDVAPTVAEWLGIPAPLDASGRSVLEDLTGAGR